MRKYTVEFIREQLNLPRERNKYHLDHVYSIMDGFRNNVSVEIIAHPNNLQMLTEHDNIMKRDISDMLLEELYNTYNNWRKSCHVHLA